MEYCDLNAEAEQRLEYFKERLRQRGASVNTINTYARSLWLYESLYGNLSLESLNDYRNYLIAHYKPSTANSRIYGMNQYLKLLEQDGAEIPAGYQLAAVKLQHRPFLDNVISQRDYERLKRGLKEDHNVFWYFVVHFLGSTGARISELLQIKAEHIRMGYMDLYSKGGKVRRVYFPEALCRDALDWLETRGLQTGFVFTNRNGAPFTARGISSQLKVLARRYRINPDTVYPHSFRHRFAKNFLSRFNDIALLADLMGHDSIETTRIYLTRSSNEQRAIIDEIVTW